MQPYGLPVGQMTDQERMFLGGEPLYGTAAQGAARESQADRLAMDIERARQNRMMREQTLQQIQPSMPEQPLMRHGAGVDPFGPNSVGQQRSKVPGMGGIPDQPLMMRGGDGRVAKSKMDVNIGLGIGGHQVADAKPYSSQYPKITEKSNTGTVASSGITPRCDKGGGWCDVKPAQDGQFNKYAGDFIGSNGFSDNFGSFGPTSGPNALQLLRGMYG